MKILGEKSGNGTSIELVRKMQSDSRQIWNLQRKGKEEKESGDE